MATGETVSRKWGWMKRGMVLGVVALAILVNGCSAPPDQEAADARAALRGAHDAEADVYAPEELTLAESALTRAEEEQKLQNDRFRVFRSYDLAKELFVETRDLAVAAGDAARRHRSDRVVESDRLLAQATRAVEACSDTLAGAPRGKGTKIDIALFEQDISDLSADVASIQARIDTGLFELADSASADISRRATALQEEIVTASRRRR